MSKPTLLLVTAILAISVTLAQAGTLHRVTRQAIPREFQNINIENYLKNPRAVQFQLKCVIYDGPCDRIGKYLKVSIPELLTNQCRNCQPEQRKQTGRLVAFLQQNYPKEWEDAIKKFQGGRQFTGDEVKRFEQEYGIKADGVSTVAPPSADVAKVEVTTEKVSAADAANILKGFGAQYLEAQRKTKDGTTAKSVQDILAIITTPAPASSPAVSASAAPAAVAASPAAAAPAPAASPAAPAPAPAA
jgi:hypothetical protein